MIESVSSFQNSVGSFWSKHSDLNLSKNQTFVFITKVMIQFKYFDYNNLGVEKEEEI